MRAGDLDPVVQPDKQPRQDRGQRELDHHQAVERGGGQDHDRAERHLHQPEARDLVPAQGAHQPIARSAKAATIMPET